MGTRDLHGRPPHEGQRARGVRRRVRLRQRGVRRGAAAGWHDQEGEEEAAGRPGRHARQGDGRVPRCTTLRLHVLVAHAGLAAPSARRAVHEGRHGHRARARLGEPRRKDGRRRPCDRRPVQGCLQAVVPAGQTGRELRDQVRRGRAVRRRCRARLHPGGLRPRRWRRSRRRHGRGHQRCPRSARGVHVRKAQTGVEVPGQDALGRLGFGGSPGHVQGGRRARPGLRPGPGARLRLCSGTSTTPGASRDGPTRICATRSTAP